MDERKGWAYITIMPSARGFEAKCRALFGDSFRLTEEGLRAIMKSPTVVADLEARGQRVKAAAEARGVMVDWPDRRHPMPYQVSTSLEGTRARVRVTAAHPAGLAAEAKYHALTSSIDAAAR